MSAVLVALGAVTLAVIGSEIVLRGMKVQTGLSRVVWVYLGIGAPAMATLTMSGQVGAGVFSIYWGGAFLTWFGVRSHIESSILLRMLYMLSRQPATGEELLARYGAEYGLERRMQELLRAGLTESDAGRVRVTAKGKMIARAAGWLE